MVVFRHIFVPPNTSTGEGEFVSDKLRTYEAKGSTDTNTGRVLRTRPGETAGARETRKKCSQNTHYFSSTCWVGKTQTTLGKSTQGTVSRMNDKKSREMRFLSSLSL